MWEWELRSSEFICLIKTVCERKGKNIRLEVHSAEGDVTAVSPPGVSLERLLDRLRCGRICCMRKYLKARWNCD